jgi:hypothetical protein
VPTFLAGILKLSKKLAGSRKDLLHPVYDAGPLKVAHKARRRVGAAFKKGSNLLFTQKWL